MDGIHDLGGMHGFGPVVTERDEPPFHEAWEGRMHGMMLAAAVAGVMPAGMRHAIERMDPAHYLSSSYYEHWLAAAETLLAEAGVISAGELDAKVDDLAGEAPALDRQDPDAAAVIRSLLRPFSVTEHDGPRPRFGCGDRVTVRRVADAGHNRCPRYARGATGRIERVHGPEPLPDLTVRDEGRTEPIYTVRFEASDLWGDAAEPGAPVLVDLFESYLEADD